MPLPWTLTTYLENDTTLAYNRSLRPKRNTYLKSRISFLQELVEILKCSLLCGISVQHVDINLSQVMLVDFGLYIGRGQKHVVNEQAGARTTFLHSRNEGLEDLDTDVIRVVVDDLAEEEKPGIGDGLWLVEAVLHKRDAVLDTREIRSSGALLKHDSIDVLYDKVQFGEFLYRDGD